MSSVRFVLVLPSVDTRLRRGTPGFARVGVAMFAAGAAIFALLYSPQAVLPQLSADFQVSAASAGLTMSATTAALALAIVPASALSERWGRARVLGWAVTAAAVLGVLLPFSPTYGILLAVRALQGVAMAGMPAVAMAYLADEIHPSALAGAVGTFVAGNGLGGLSGRLLGGVVTDVGGWRLGLGAVSLLSVLCAVTFVILLRGLQTHPPAPATGGGVRVHLADPVLRRLFVAGFVLMGGFVTIYNYLSYRLLRPPFDLPPAVVGLIFLAYLAGTAASALAGRLADRRGARVVLVGSVLVAIAAVLARPCPTPCPRCWPGWSWSRPASSRPTRSPAVGSAGARPPPAARPPACTCSRTTSAPAWAAGSAAWCSSGAAGRRPPCM